MHERRGEVPRAEARSGETMLEGQVYATVAQADEGRERREQLILLWSRSSGDPIVVTGVLGWQSCSNLTEAGASARIGCCPYQTESSYAPKG